MKYFEKNNGISLLEVMLSLSIIAIIVVMAVHYFSISSEESSVSLAATNVQNVVQASQDWLAGQKAADFAGVSPTAIVNAGLATNKDFANPWYSNVPICIAPGATSTHIAVYVLVPYTTSCNLLASELSKAILVSPSTQCDSNVQHWPNACPPLGSGVAGLIFAGEF